MRVEPLAFVDVLTGERVGCAEFVARFPSVQALAGIGNPARFAETLGGLGLQVRLRALPDHHRYTGAELAPSMDVPIVCTEKDAIKLRQLPDLGARVAPQQLWLLEIDVAFEAEAVARLDAILRARGIGPIESPS
jgi:tetraacyldisaccharide 4'-kinase